MRRAHDSPSSNALQVFTRLRQDMVDWLESLNITYRKRVALYVDRKKAELQEWRNMRVRQHQRRAPDLESNVVLVRHRELQDLADDLTKQSHWLQSRVTNGVESVKLENKRLQTEFKHKLQVLSPGGGGGGGGKASVLGCLPLAAPIGLWGGGGGTGGTLRLQSLAAAESPAFCGGVGRQHRGLISYPPPPPQNVLADCPRGFIFVKRGHLGDMAIPSVTYGLGLRAVLFIARTCVAILPNLADGMVRLVGVI